MTGNWFKSPTPLMQRTLADDIRWAAFVLAGVVLALLILGADDASALVGAIVGVITVVVVLNVLRRVRRPGS